MNNPVDTAHRGDLDAVSRVLSQAVGREARLLAAIRRHAIEIVASGGLVLLTEERVAQLKREIRDIFRRVGSDL